MKIFLIWINEASRENRSEAGHEASREEGKDSASQPIRELKAYVSGEVIPMEDVPDQVFASRALGDGVAIKPEDGVLRAPADAMVAADISIVGFHHQQFVRGPHLIVSCYL